MKLCAVIARKFGRSRCQPMDLISEGIYGLMVACDRFDVTRGTSFGSYAINWVKAYVTRFIARQYSIAQGGASIKTSIFFTLVRERAKLLCQHGDNDKVIGLLSERFETRAETLRGWLHKIDFSDVSIDAPPEPGCPWPLTDTSEWDPGDKIDYARRYERLIAGLNAAIDTLPPKQQQIVWSILDSDPDNEITMQAIGNQMGISRERVRQLRNKAFQTIRQFLEAA